MGQERSTPWRRNKPLAKNALPAAVVPRRDRAKGNREERGGHHAAIWTDLSTKHTEEIKVMQAPFKCASMLGHRLSVHRNKASNQSINQCDPESSRFLRRSPMLKIPFYVGIVARRHISQSTTSLLSLVTRKVIALTKLIHCLQGTSI